MYEVSKAGALKLLFLTSLMGASGVANASLPDEIDFRTYGSIYEQSKYKSQSARAEASEAFERLAATISAIESTQDAIQASEDNIQRNISDIDSLDNQIVELSRQIKDLTAQNDSLFSDIRDLKSEVSNLDGQIANNEDRLRAPKQRLNDLNIRFDELQRQRSALINEKNEFEGYLAKETRILNAMIGDLENLRRIREDIKMRMPERVRKIDLLKDGNKKLVNRVQSLEAQVAGKQAAVNSLEQEVKPARQALRQAKSQRDALKAEVGPLIKRESNARSALSSAKKALKSNQDEIQSATTRITALENQKGSLPGQIESLRNTISSQESDLASKKATQKASQQRMNQARNEQRALAVEFRKIQQMPDSPTKTQKLNELKAKGQALTEERKALSEVIRKLRMEIPALEKSLASNKTSLTSKTRTLATINSQLQSEKTKKQNLVSKTAGLKAKVQSAKAELESAVAALGNKKTRLANLETKVKAAQDVFDAKNSELTTAKVQLRKVTDSIEKARARIKSNIAEIRKEERELERDSREFAKVKEDIRDVRRQIPGQESRVAGLENRVSSIFRELDNVEGETRTVDARIGEVSREVQSLENYIAELVSQRNSALDTMDAKSNQMDQNDQTMKRHDNQIASNQQSIQDLEKQINDLKINIGNLEISLSSLLDDKQEQTDDYNDKDLYAKKLEAITQNDLMAFEKRDSLYKSYKSQAYNLGEDQGFMQGQEPGESAGFDEAKKDAGVFGAKNGDIIGKLSGYLKGLNDGKEAGNTQGYSAGVNSKEDYGAGYESGYAVGLKKAKDEAKATDYPMGIAQMKEELLKDVPGNQISVDSNMVTESLSFKSAAISAESFAGFGIAKSDVESAIDKVIAQTESEIEYFETPKVAMSEANLVYESPSFIPVDSKRLDCSSVYKNVRDFIAACENGFGDGFKTSFAASHRDIFFAEYSGLFKLEKEDAYTKSFSTREKEGFDEAYAVVFKEAKARGGKVAYANGYDNGDSDGYSENIKSEKEKAFAQGQADTQDFFAHNAVIRVDNSKAISVDLEKSEKGFEQGASFDVNLGLVNFGKASSGEKDTIVSVVASSSNVIFDTNVKKLSGLSARAKVNVTDVFKVKIKDSAMPGSPIKFDLKVTSPNEIGENVTKIVSFSEKVTVNPEVKSDLKYGKEVNSYKRRWFKKVWLTHDVKMVLEGLRANVPGDYKVTAEILEGSKHVTLENSEVKITSPGAKGQKSEGIIKYKFKKDTDAKDETLSFKLTLSYDGEVLKTEVIKVKVDK